jgi:hypothetical protein
MEAGLPDGAIRPPPDRPLDATRVRAAVLRIASGPLDQRRRELLLAWLRGFRRHWPSRFAEVLGAEGEALEAELRSLPVDENRYLKLRRIAIENLSHIV